MQLDALLTRYLRLLQDRSDNNRLPFEIDQRVIGSVSEPDARLLSSQIPGVELSDDCLTIAPVCSPDSPAVLEVIASTLREAGRCGQWRNEQLPVTADDGTLVGSIERACVRALGIRTFAVHCSAQVAPDDRKNGNYTVWLQRRAPDKAVDPGKLDTLAGGLIGMETDAAMESFSLGLAREIQEEAGLSVDQYQHPEHIETVRCRADLGPEGYFEEDCLVFHTQVLPGITPHNLDGEVSEFLRVDQQELITLIDAGELTQTASIASILAIKHLGENTPVR